MYIIQSDAHLFRNYSLSLVDVELEFRFLVKIFKCSYNNVATTRGNIHFKHGPELVCGSSPKHVNQDQEVDMTSNKTRGSNTLETVEGSCSFLSDQNV